MHISNGMSLDLEPNRIPVNRVRIFLREKMSVFLIQRYTTSNTTLQGTTESILAWIKLKILLGHYVIYLS